MTALLDQPPLFAGTGSHAVTVDRVLVPYVVESAGQLSGSPGRVRAAGTRISRGRRTGTWLCGSARVTLGAR
jgi:hypothetical protein